MTQFVKYTRVSTREQGLSGLGLEAQDAAIATYVVSVDGTVVADYSDVQSGKLEYLPGREAAITKARELNIPLIATKLDRISRSAAYLMGLQDSSLEVVIVESPQMGLLEYGIKAVVSWNEGIVISQRTRAALAAKKARGFKLGNPKPVPASKLGVQANRQIADYHAASIMPVIEHLRTMGITSLRALATELQQRKNAPTLRGGAWSAQQVKNTLQRYASLSPQALVEMQS